jgi:hypothetical protein
MIFLSTKLYSRPGPAQWHVPHVRHWASKKLRPPKENLYSSNNCNKGVQNVKYFFKLWSPISQLPVCQKKKKRSNLLRAAWPGPVFQKKKIKRKRSEKLKEKKKGKRSPPPSSLIKQSHHNTGKKKFAATCIQNVLFFFYILKSHF